MRTAIIAFIAVGVWLPGLAHAQDTACDAEPRYLVVTVVGSEWVEIDGTSNESLRDVFGGGVRMFDRCEYAGLTLDGSGVNRRRPDLDGQHGAIATLHFRDGSYALYFVRESLHDICAVLADCADATK